jgi:hypothetical protein
MKTPSFTRRDFVFIADHIAPMMHWPTHIHDLADMLDATNPRFNRERFIERATKAWEANYQANLENINDEIDY